MQQQDLVIYAIATIILVGSWVVNILRKQAEEREEAGQSSSASDDGSSKRRLDDLAARRREELRAQARERRGDTGGRPGAGEPANMTMAERIARARAKAQYEQRAQQLGQRPAQQTGGVAQPSPRPEPVAVGGHRQEQGTATEMERARQRDKQRRDAERRQRLEAERRAQVERDRQRRLHQQQRQLAEQASENKRRQAEEAAARRRNQQSSASTRTRTAERQSAYTPAITSGERRPLPFTQRSLREAVVLREVFDRPLAMRDPLAERNY